MKTDWLKIKKDVLEWMETNEWWIITGEFKKRIAENKDCYCLAGILGRISGKTFHSIDLESSENVFDFSNDVFIPCSLIEKYGFKHGTCDVKRFDQWFRERDGQLMTAEMFEDFINAQIKMEM